MDFTAGQRETITEVCAGDLVHVRLELRDGKMTPDARGRLPHLIYKPYFAGDDISPRMRHHLHGDDPLTPEWQLDIGTFWAPTPGLLAIAGGAGDARFHVFRTVQRCLRDPGLNLTLSFHRVDGVIARPRGAQWVQITNATTVRLSAADHSVNVSMEPAGPRCPLGFATSVQPLTMTSLFFGIVV